MSAFLLAIKKLIAVITAIFIPTTSAAAVPVIPHHARVVNVSVTENYEDRSQMQIVEDEENINPMIDENGENAEDPANETPAPVEEDPANEPQALTADEQEAPADDVDHTRAEEIPAVQSWDVSATEDDNVTMTFYDTEDTESLLNQLAGRITALFTPMTAYADDRIVTDDENATVVEDGNSTITIIKGDTATGNDNEFGNVDDNGNAIAPLNNYGAGTIVVSGEGNMMDYVYNLFIGTDLYVDTVVNLFRDVKGIDVKVDVDTTIQDIVELEKSARYYDKATGEEVFIDEEMRQNLNPAEMLKYSPTHIIIEDGVTNISDYAFAMCADIVSVDMPESVLAIGNGAFAYCTNLENVHMPKGLIEIGESAFAYCSKLANVYIPETVEHIGYFAFENIKDNAVISTSNTTILRMFVDHDLTGEARVTLQFAL